MNPRETHRMVCRHSFHRLLFLAFLAASALLLRAQEPTAGAGQSSVPPEKTQGIPAQSQSPKPPAEPKQEVSMQDTGTTFKLRVNLVQVHVIVRDNSNKPVANLTKDDFQLFDNGKLQSISTFGIETAKSRQERADAAAKTQSSEGETTAGGSVVLPERFVAMTFDDVHLKMEDAVTVRVAAGKFIDGMTPVDRVGIFSTSGQTTQDFTSDKEALKRTLLSLMPRDLAGSRPSDCPDVSYYMADQIENRSDPQALAVVVSETLQCMYGNDPRMLSAAQSSAQAAVMQALSAGDANNNYTYRKLEDVLRLLSGKPGERILLLASPGFLIAFNSTDARDANGLVERANRANIVINTLDARGLYVPDVGGDITQRTSDTAATAGLKGGYRIAEQAENAYVLMDFAYGTGGTFFHNSNDLEGGLKLAGGVPEVSYVLGFSPPNQKMDGTYHTIKVKLAGKQKYAIQARRGYYAPKKLNDPQEIEKQEIQDAVFSQDEIDDLPLSLQTQYFKTDNTDARLSVVSRVELKGMHFRKADGRNLDNLTVATVIFDENGNYVTGGSKLVQMRLLDTTYEKLSRSGLTVKSSFDVKPGRYMVRQVVRDSEGAQMAARNGTVVIPY
jgi:VWFA-related protein